MKIGLYYDLRNPKRWERPWSEFYGSTIEQIEHAEGSGLDSVWFTEHHLWEDGYLPQPLTFAAAVAVRTKKIRVGTGVVLAPLRLPIDLAEQAAIVDILSNGRVELGLGAGYVVPEFQAFGVDIKDRFALLEDRVSEVRRLWDEEIATPPPVQDRPPIWVGGFGKRAAGIAGRTGEGLLAFDDEQLALYRKTLAESGHDPDSARVGGLINLIVADDPERTWKQVAPHLSYQWTTYAHYGSLGTDVSNNTLLTDLEASEVDPEGLRDKGPEMNAPRFDVVTPEEAISRLTTWLTEMPVVHGYFWGALPGLADEVAVRHIELLATKVGPALKDLGTIDSGL